MPKGYDNIWLNSQLLLDLQFREGSGSRYYDFAKPHHVVTGVGVPAWFVLPSDLYYLSFNSAIADYITATSAATADLDFTTESFSLAIWIDPDLNGNRYLFARGLTINDGWAFYYSPSNTLSFSTNQAGVAQHTTGTAGEVVVGTWCLAGVTRSGATARIYCNGVESTATYGTHVAPLTSARNFYIGRADLGAGPYDGDVWRPRIWERALSAAEMKSIFEMERGYFGV